MDWLEVFRSHNRLKQRIMSLSKYVFNELCLGNSKIPRSQKTWRGGKKADWNETWYIWDKHLVRRVNCLFPRHITWTKSDKTNDGTCALFFLFSALFRGHISAEGQKGMWGQRRGHLETDLGTDDAVDDMWTNVNEVDLDCFPGRFESFRSGCGGWGDIDRPKTWFRLIIQGFLLALIWWSTRIPESKAPDHDAAETG